MPPTLDEILAIPGNRPVFDALVKLLDEERVIAFVGAGASTPMYPLWGRFIQLFAQHAADQGKAEQADADRWKADTQSTPQQRVDTICRKVGDALYRDFLKLTFGPVRGGDGKRYTPTHASLLKLPFRGYVTTNYDPELEIARAELRDSLSTGTPTWQDDDEVYAWRTSDIFKRDCPMLWIHGYWQRPGGIVLNSGGYDRAYRQSIYRETFKELWVREHLVFVGFGFNDPRFTFMVGQFLADIQGASPLSRHIAVLGWPMPMDGSAVDPVVVREKRDGFEADYNTRTLFYPIFKRRTESSEWDDHSALDILLQGVISRCRQAAPMPVVSEAVSCARALQNKWVHETSNDAQFTGREREIEKLNRWVRDPAVRAIGICAVGGTGKTALIGHWLKMTDGWRTRPFSGLFAWSFYQDSDTDNFLEQLLAWGHAGAAIPDEKADLVDEALKLIRGHACVVVLDGLEVLQEGPDAARHGAFLDGQLREFLTAFCQAEHQSLAVLTSRFVFPDLERYLGTAFHQVELHGLPPDQGARLLGELGVRGRIAERESISDRLDGHPLGLRVFAGALPDGERDQPAQFLDHAFHLTNLAAEAPLTRRVTSVLGFYEKRLPDIQVRLLSVISLFRTPVADATVVRLVRGIFSRTSDKALPDDSTMAHHLELLHARGILTREPVEGGHGSACHPILRDHFRSVLLGCGDETVRQAADLLKGPPSKATPQSVKEIEPLLLSIELLLDAGDFIGANALYRARLRDGDLFKWLPAVKEGLDCARGFVLNETRCDQCKELLAPEHLALFLGDVSLFAGLSGQYELALDYRSREISLYRELKDSQNLCISLQNESELFVWLGRLDAARRSAADALQIAEEEQFVDQISHCFAYLGWAMLMAGQIQVAADGFARANEVVKTNDPDGNELDSLVGIWWSELLVRAGDAPLADGRTLANLRVCSKNNWNQLVARCRWMLGACALAMSRPSDAAGELALAEPVLHRGQLLFDLARLHVTAGYAALAGNDAIVAHDRATQAYDLAATRGMRLVHADSLVLRGQARLHSSDFDGAYRALDDAEEALRIARDCGYVWAERDALFLQADALFRLKQTEASRRAHADAELIASRLRLTQASLDEAEAKAKEWLAEWNQKTKGARRRRRNSFGVGRN